MTAAGAQCPQVMGGGDSKIDHAPCRDGAPPLKRQSPRPSGVDKTISACHPRRRCIRRRRESPPLSAGLDLVAGRSQSRPTTKTAPMLPHGAPLFLLLGSFVSLVRRGPRPVAVESRQRDCQDADDNAVQPGGRPSVAVSYEVVVVYSRERGPFTESSRERKRERERK
ncbi:hypothetical protein HPB51_013899 [Rhipicephalus microplus]|uniref:Uncharacterized protein n=1 Tax=Rhipicephalus microplus TaxID=6941 RepID=A0A9J6D596_RHIMP|nr:hypothetical protein HPB51_013899 [Rhipicephalus microplus]